jgi:pyridoxamine 5'-phosphate oxidase
VPTARDDQSIADLRRNYTRATLDEADVDVDPIAQFGRWFAEARAAQLAEPNAMTLATSTPDGRPSARIVLLKGVDARGFVFYTDYRSRKGAELAANPHAALVFHWGELERQVRVVGTVSVVSREESAAYFAGRPAGSRRGAWASHQSQPITERVVLERQFDEVTRRFTDDDAVPLPEHWGGYRVSPTEVEFWQGRASRLHDRIHYVLDGDLWRRERLSP